MRPMANFWDKLQEQDKCYMSFLLPKLSTMMKKLKDARKDLKITVPLVDALLSGMQKRFDGYSKNDSLILANITILQFQL